MGLQLVNLPLQALLAAKVLSVAPAVVPRTCYRANG